MKKSDIALAGLVLFIIIAIVLAVAIMRQGGQEDQGATPTPLPSGGETPKDLTAEEKAVLIPPGPNDSEQKRKEHFALVERLAKEAEYLDITDCKSIPVVLRAKKGSEIQLRNTSKVDHALVIDKDHVYTVPAEKTLKVKADFGKGAGVYGYGCDKSTGATGMMLIYEQ